MATHGFRQAVERDAGEQGAIMSSRMKCGFNTIFHLVKLSYNVCMRVIETVIELMDRSVQSQCFNLHCYKTKLIKNEKAFTKTNMISFSLD